ncbi:MAG: SPASM domain-containing protein [Ruminococcus flavefaciens]|nr:SPASM domain-containing protein [Ruminococcus flavefaciens]
MSNIEKEEILGVMDSCYQRAARESRQYDTIVIFGAGNSAVHLYKKMNELQVEIEAFLVSDKRTNRNDIDGISVLQIDEAQINRNTTLVLIGVSKISAQEVIEILDKNGFQHYFKFDAGMAWGNLENARRTLPAIEITTQIGCSVNCRYCPQDVLLSRYFENNKEREKRFTLKNYKKCLQNLPDDTVITFSGFCEPFLNPKCSDMICYTAGHGNRMSLHTTLVGMTMEDFERIKDLPFENIILHTPDKHKYANIPITNTYLQVLDSMLDAKNKNGEPLIKIANCQSEPDEEILKIINHRVSFSSARLQDRAGNIKEEAVSEGINHEGEIECVKSPKLHRNVLLPDGSLVLCCMDFGLKHEIGNLLYNSYYEIVNGKILEDIKSNMKNGGDVLCRKCSSARRI